MDRQAFFDHIREHLSWRTWKVPYANTFKHKYAGFQVRGLDALLNEAERRGWDLRWTAYALATAYWETARTMTPIREYGRGRGREYGRKDPRTGHAYYGRGFVQLTWLFNYRKASEKLGVDFVNNPDRVLEPRHAACIMFDGMEGGWFTGKSLGDYFTDNKTGWRSARRIVNGLDRAKEIAGIARVFHAALKTAQPKEVSR